MSYHHHKHNQLQFSCAKSSAPRYSSTINTTVAITNSIAHARAHTNAHDHPHVHEHATCIHTIVYMSMRMHLYMHIHMPIHMHIITRMSVQLPIHMQIPMQHVTPTTQALQPHQVSCAAISIQHRACMHHYTGWISPTTHQYHVTDIQHSNTYTSIKPPQHMACTVTYMCIYMPTATRSTSQMVDIEHTTNVD